MRLMKYLAVGLFFFSAAAFADAPVKGSFSSSKKIGLQSQHQNPTQDCGNLTARSLAYVCDRITDAGQTNQCFAAGSGHYLDQCALGACDRFNEAGPTIQCVQAIADRSYELDEVLACDRMTGVQDTLDCFSYAGQWVGGNQGVNIREVKRYVVDALDYLNQNRVEGARLTLEDLLEYLRQYK